MEVPDWWDERRFGVFVRMSGAAVPAWAPIGARADRYRHHLGDAETAAGAPTTALVEVVAHHRDRWGHIPHFDDFIPLLRFGEFDAEAWARLVVDAGAGYAATVALDGDGWVWWDAPTTTRTMVTNGPHRNVIADFASACERNDLPLGVSYALTEAGDRDDPEALASHDLTDLVDRYGIEFIRLEGHPSPGAPIDADGIDVRVFEGLPPVEILDHPWELRRDINRGAGYNRAERQEHLLDAHGVIALLTETVAKGGHLLLGVGVDSEGTIPDLHATPLRDAGAWIRRHERLVNSGRPWTSWGDADTRLIAIDGAIGAVDIAGRGEFADLDTNRCRVDAVELGGLAVPFHQDADGLHIDLHRSPVSRRRDNQVDIDVYQVHVSEPERPAGLFESTPREPIQLAPLLRTTASGDILQLGDGVYVGPAIIPADVTVRGLGGNRTIIEPAGDPVVIGTSARMEHLHVRRPHDEDRPTVAVRGDSALILGCQVEGMIDAGADDLTIRATSVSSVHAVGIEHLSIVRCQIADTAFDAGVHIVGGSRHRVDSCEIDGHDTAIHLAGAIESAVTGNNLSARHAGVRLERTEGTDVQGNFVSHTMRGFHIDGGTTASVHGNAVCDGDSGVVVERGATNCTITGNTWERCRIAVLTWDVTDIEVHANNAIDLHGD